MVRGPKKHMKRLAAPKHWMTDKLGGVYAPKARPGAHKGRESLPLILVLRNRLKYALTRSEAMMITKQRLVEVDGRVRVDPKTPVGFMDIVSLPKTKETYRVLYDVKGRFVMLRTEATTQKVCKVIKVSTAPGGVPVLSTHDGRTLRYPDPLIASGDSVLVDVAKGTVQDFVKFKEGVVAMITGGANTGRVGEVLDVERHPGSFNIVHVKDANGNTFATRQTNVFIIGRRSDDLMLELPKAKGVRVPLEQDREQKIVSAQKNKAGKNKKH